MTLAEYQVAVGELIRRQRLALDISQAAIAKAVGVSEASISRWELGNGAMSAYSLSRLRAFFKAEWAARVASGAAPVAKQEVEVGQ